MTPLPPSRMTEVSCEPWGEVPGQGPAHLWTLQSPEIKVEVLTLGGIIKSVYSRGKDGESVDIVLGFDNLEGEIIQWFQETFIIHLII